MTTKRNLLLVSLFLVLGLVAMVPTAVAQTQWAAGTANENGFARAEGITEASGLVTLTQSGFQAGTVGSGTEIVVYYTTSTSAGAPNVNIINVGTVTITCYGTGFSPFVGPPAGCNGYIGAPYLTATLLNRTPVSEGPVLHIPFYQTPFGNPATGDGSSISVSARLDVAHSALYPHGGSVQGVVTAYTPAGVTQSFTITGNPSVAGTVMAVAPEPALGLSWGIWCNSDDSTSCETSSTAYVLLCLGVIHNSEQYERYFTLNVGENFTYALTSEAYEITLDSGTTSPGTVTNSTLITVVLSNIPNHFGISAGEPIACTEVTATETSYCPSGTLDVEPYSGSDTSYWNSTGTNTGTASFEYEVDMVDSGTPENVNLPFKFYSGGPIGTAGLPCITAQIYKQPNDASDSVSIPRFLKVAENTTPLKVICFDNCVTNLLFPEVLNVGVWDTDIAIANTTMDPLAMIGQNSTPVNKLLIKGSATPQNGSCSFYYYSGSGLAPGVGPTGPLATWSLPVLAGTTYAESLAAMGRIPAGTTGYLWGFCNFSQAYGYAAINYSFGTDSGILADYIAVNIPDPEWSPRDRNGDGMGENAITPLNVTRDIEKALAGFSGSSSPY